MLAVRAADERVEGEQVQELEALRSAYQRAQLVDEVEPGDLTRPTPCSDWDVRGLVAHSVAGADGLAVQLRGVTPDWQKDTLGDDPAAELRQSLQNALTEWRRPGAVETASPMVPGNGDRLGPHRAGPGGGPGLPQQPSGPPPGAPSVNDLEALTRARTVRQELRRCDTRRNRHGACHLRPGRRAGLLAARLSAEVANAAQDAVGV